MPRYSEIPDVGLFLEQTVKYINSYLSPLGCIEITPSMVSNYVKKGYISNPTKKQYNAQQIASLFFIAVVKNVISMDNIQILFKLQQEQYTSQIAYDYFCNELENTLLYIFEHTNTLKVDNTNLAPAKKMLQSVIFAVAHIIYLSNCFEEMKE